MNSSSTKPLLGVLLQHSSNKIYNSTTSTRRIISTSGGFGIGRSSIGTYCRMSNNNNKNNIMLSYIKRNQKEVESIYKIIYSNRFLSTTSASASTATSTTSETSSSTIATTNTTTNTVDAADSQVQSQSVSLPPLLGRHKIHKYKDNTISMSYDEHKQYIDNYKVQYDNSKYKYGVEIAEKQYNKNMNDNKNFLHLFLFCLIIPWFTMVYITISSNNTIKRQQLINTINSTYDTNTNSVTNILVGNNSTSNTNTITDEDHDEETNDNDDE